MLSHLMDRKLRLVFMLYMMLIVLGSVSQTDLRTVCKLSDFNNTNIAMQCNKRKNSTATQGNQISVNENA